LTLAASVETRNGHRAVADAGASRDLALSLARASRRTCATSRAGFRVRSCPSSSTSRRCRPCWRGRCPRRAVSARCPRSRPPRRATCSGRGDRGPDRRGRGAGALLRRPDPGALLAGLELAGLSVDLSLPVDGGDDALAAWLDAGRLLLAARCPCRAAPTSADVAADVRSLAQRLGFGVQPGCGWSVVTPVCGLAGQDLPYARGAMTTARDAAARLAAGPEGEGGDR